MRLPFDVRFLVLGVLVYIISLILTFPADRAYAYWRNADLSRQMTSRQFSLMGIHGSVWSGTADTGMVGGQRLESFEWHLRPWSLLLGRVGLSWSCQLPESANKQGHGRGITSVGLDGSVAFSELEARVPASMMASMANLSALRPSGMISLNLQDMEWDGQGLVSAEGRVVWNGAGISLLKPVALGDLTLTVETENGTVKGVIADSGGPLSISGVATLSADGNYQFKGALAARNDQDLKNALRSVGRPGPDGKVKVNYSGNLASLGILPRSSRR